MPRDAECSPGFEAHHHFSRRPGCRGTGNPKSSTQHPPSTLETLGSPPPGWRRSPRGALRPLAAPAARAAAPAAPARTARAPPPAPGRTARILAHTPGPAGPRAQERGFPPPPPLAPRRQPRARDNRCQNKREGGCGADDGVQVPAGEPGGAGGAREREGGVDGECVRRRGRADVAGRVDGAHLERVVAAGEALRSIQEFGALGFENLYPVTLSFSKPHGSNCTDVWCFRRCSEASGTLSGQAASISRVVAALIHAPDSGAR